MPRRPADPRRSTPRYGATDPTIGSTRVRTVGTPRNQGDPSHTSFQVEDSLFLQMSRVIGTYSIAISRTLKSVDSDIPRWRILMLAHLRGPISMGEIADMAGLLPSTVTKVVRRLQREKLVVVDARRSDKRVKDVSATDSGRRAAEVLLEICGCLFHEATRDLSVSDIVQFKHTLARLQRSLRTLV